MTDPFKYRMPDGKMRLIAHTAMGFSKYRPNPDGSRPTMPYTQFYIALSRLCGGTPTPMAFRAASTWDDVGGMLPDHILTMPQDDLIAALRAGIALANPDDVDWLQHADSEIR